MTTNDIGAALRFVLLACCVACAGCGNDNTVTAPSTTPIVTAGTDTFASFLAVGGSTARTFPAAQAGTVTVTLTSVTPSAVIGLGIGIPGQGTTNCRLTRSVDATPGTTPQLTISVDAGVYCVQVYDSGFVPGLGVSFSTTIVRP